ncbi:MAG: M24 family metallopeptidase [Candidatus Bathycorpusculaceae bacterium]
MREQIEDVYEKSGKTEKIGRNAGINAFLLNSEKNMRYFAGFSVLSLERFAGVIIPVDNQTPILVVPKLEVKKAKERSAFKQIKSYDDSENPAILLKQIIREQRLEKTTFGVEWTLPFKFYRMLTECSPEIKVEDASNLFSQLRSIKSAEEIEKMKKAASIVADGIKAGIDSIRPEVSELSISFEIEKTIKQSGGESVPFCLVLSGSNSALPHGETSNRKIAKKDVLLMDVGALYEGYYADLTRTVFVGKATKIQRKIYETVLRAQETAIKAVKSGIEAEEVDVIARKVIEDSGYGRYFTHRTGHGLGLEVHEEPYIAPGDKTVLRHGMTFTIEPGIYLPKKFGVRIEDDIVVSKAHGELLSTLCKELLIL